ncbi:MAG: type II toxin-antitoxin system RelE/ParE family toxin [Pseudomonadota bacterium]
MTRYNILIERGAEQDLEDIVTYIAERESVDRAIEVASKIEGIIAGLAAYPNRGAYPRELLDYGNRDFRQVYFKPYRIIYRVLDKEVVVVLVADGRRDMHALLARRLLAD